MKKRNPNASAPLTALERIATALEAHLKLLQGGPILYGEVETAAEPELIAQLRARVAELEAEVESSRRADVAIDQALNEGDGSYRP